MADGAKRCAEQHRTVFLRPGFTLLELLIAITILGLLLSGLAGGIRLGTRAFERQATAIAERDQIDATDRALRRLLSTIDPGSPNNPPKIEGTPTSFKFTSDLPPGVGLTIKRADLVLSLTGKGSLVLKYKQHFHDMRTSPEPEAKVVEILSGLDKIELSYFKAAEQANGGSGWLAEWRDPIPPDLIRLHLVFPKGDRRHWPDLIVAPMLQQEQN